VALALTEDEKMAANVAAAAQARAALAATRPNALVGVLTRPAITVPATPVTMLTPTLRILAGEPSSALAAAAAAVQPPLPPRTLPLPGVTFSASMASMAAATARTHEPTPMARVGGLLERLVQDSAYRLQPQGRGSSVFSGARSGEAVHALATVYMDESVEECVCGRFPVWVVFVFGLG
jgi:hypothetical protein